MCSAADLIDSMIAFASDHRDVIELGVNIWLLLITDGPGS